MRVTSSPLLFVLVFLALALATEGVLALVHAGAPARVRRSRARLRRLASSVQAGGDEHGILRHPEEARLVRVVRRVPFADALALELYRAGRPHSLPGLAAWSAGLAGVGFTTLLLVFGDAAMGTLGLAFGALPWLRVRRLARQRARRFEAQFPEALDLLIRALRAGHSLTTGLQLVGEELPDPVGTEFAQVAHEIGLGQDARRALANLAHRVESGDLPFFVTAVRVQQETGSNLAEVLANLAHVIRERFRLYGKVRALTALGRASASVLAVWPFVTVAAVGLVSPDYVAPLWESPEGHRLALASLAMIAVGYAGARRLATIRV